MNIPDDEDDDDWTFDAQRVDHVPVNARLAALGRRLVAHPRLALVALRVPLLGRLVAAAAEAEWRDVVDHERRERGID